MNDKERAAAALEWLEKLQKKAVLSIYHAECKPHVTMNEMNWLRMKLENIKYVIKLVKAQLENAGGDTDEKQQTVTEPEGS